MPALSSTTSILPFFKAIIKYATPVPNSANDWLLNIYENCRFMVCVNNLKFLVYRPGTGSTIGRLEIFPVLYLLRSVRND